MAEVSNPNSVVDARARQEALDPSRSFIVQAPAGSGKTELLTQRYLTLMARVDAPEEIVALTFTRKAAGEMRSRIISALRRAQDSSPPLENHAQLTWRLARAALERDRACQWELLRNPNRLRITTIDSLCAALTRQMPLLSRYGAMPAIVEDASELYREAARRTIAELETGERWSDAIAHLILHLDNNLAHLESLIMIMLGRRDQWLRHVADPQDPRIERDSLEAALRRSVTSVLAELHDAVPEALVDDITIVARDAARELELGGIDSPIHACAGLTTLPGSSPEVIDVWRGLAHLLLTTGNTWRSRVTADTGFPPPSGTADKTLKAKRKAMKARFVALIERLEPMVSLRERLAQVRQLPELRYSDTQWETLAALFELLRLASAQLEVVSAERGECDFVAVTQAALVALGLPDEPTDLALSLDYRMQHILVDEFQDTSLNQFSLLHSLTGGWASGDGRTLFLVGDPMQSIYRFRDAQVGLYLRAWRHGLGSVHLEPIALSVNFRSSATIVSWVNRVFAKVLPPHQDVASGAVPYAESVAFNNEGALSEITLHPLVHASSRDEAHVVVDLVNESLQRHPQDNVAILVRSRTHLIDIFAAITAAGLRVRSTDIEHLGERQIVRDLSALCRAMVHLGDRIAWLAILRAPWCGLSLADLYALTGEDEHSAVWAMMRAPQRIEKLSEDGRQRVAAFAAVMNHALAARCRLPLRQWVENTWLALGGPGCVRAARELDDAQVFFTLLERLDAGGDLADFSALEAQLGKMFAMPDAGAGEQIQVMTVHRAKGLEFDTVILPGLDRVTRVDQSQLLMWMERPRQTGDSDLLLAPIKATGDDADGIYRYLAQLERRKTEHEDCRLLYVATTRARQRLHVVARVEWEDEETGKLKAPPRNALLSRLWPGVAEDFERAAATGQDRGEVERDQTAVSPHAYQYRRALPWTEPTLPAPVLPGKALALAGAPGELGGLIEFDWASELARHTGTVVHRALYRLAGEPLANWTAKRIGEMRARFASELAELGVPQARQRDAVDKVERALTATLQHERGRWILSDSHAEAATELALSGVVDGRVVNVILDRTFVDEQGVRWIVDYKTGSHEGGGLDAFLDREQERYRGQLEGYAQMMAALEDRPIQLGLYFPMLGRWRSWRYTG